MKLSALRAIHSEDDLSFFPGDRDLRFKAFSPILESLHEDKVVYCEKFVCVVRLSDIRITPERFSATAFPFLQIERDGPFNPQCPDKPWEISASWDWIRLINNHLNVPYAGWSLWPEAALVSAVEALVLAGDHAGALKLTLYEDETPRSPDV